MNQLQAVALNEGLRCKKKLWRERQQLKSHPLLPWASRRRSDLLQEGQWDYFRKCDKSPQPAQAKKTRDSTKRR
jgi:hypothetical protein